MPIRMICMANSWREHGRCVAGICQRTGGWIRPVSSNGGPLNQDGTAIDGRHIQPLDVVRMRLRQPSAITRFQKENREIVDWDWELVDQVRPEDVLGYRSRTGTVLHSKGKVVEPALLQRLPPDQWTSLQLVHARNVTFEPDARKKNRWVALFRLRNFAPQYRIGVSDPLATCRLNRGEEIGRDCLLTVSLTEPVAFPPMGPSRALLQGRSECDPTGLSRVPCPRLVVDMPECERACLLSRCAGCHCWLVQQCIARVDRGTCTTKRGHDEKPGRPDRDPALG